MASFNKVILMGNLTRDPELRYTQNGRAVARIGLAVNRTWRTDTGEQREETTFVDVDAFGRQAETLAQYLKKGNPLLVEGRLRLHTWDDRQTGQKQSKLRVDLETFRFVGGSSRDGGAPAPEPPARPRVSETPGSHNDDHNDLPPDDDVPF